MSSRAPESIRSATSGMHGCQRIWRLRIRSIGVALVRVWGLQLECFEETDDVAKSPFSIFRFHNSVVYLWGLCRGVFVGTFCGDFNNTLIKRVRTYVES